MNNLKDILIRYDNKEQLHQVSSLVYEERIRKNTVLEDRARMSSVRAKAKIKALPQPQSIKDIFAPIAEAMMNFFSDDYKWDVSGPHGLAGKFMISISKSTNGVKATKWTAPYFYSFSFVIIHGESTEIGYVNYNIDTKSYAPGTVGERNGFNHPTILIERDCSIKELILKSHPNFFNKEEK